MDIVRGSDAGGFGTQISGVNSAWRVVGAAGREPGAWPNQECRTGVVSGHDRRGGSMVEIIFLKGVFAVFHHATSHPTSPGYPQTRQQLVRRRKVRECSWGEFQMSGDLQTYHFASGGDAHMGRKLIDSARSYLDCHYLNGAYGARPMANADEDGGGMANRPGGVILIADVKRLDPTVTDAKTAIAVKAATMTVKEYCVCAGRYVKAGGSKASPGDGDLQRYLGSLGSDPQKWPVFPGNLTPRRVYGQREGGVLVWGEDCSGIRHFDCITYVNYCMTEVYGMTSFSIDMWSGAPEHGASEAKEREEAMSKGMWTSKFSGRRVHRLPNSSVQPKDGDILVGLKGINPQHIGIVAKNGTIFQAASTNAGVHGDDMFDHNKWSFLVHNFS